MDIQISKQRKSVQFKASDEIEINRDWNTDRSVIRICFCSDSAPFLCTFLDLEKENTKDKFYVIDKIKFTKGRYSLYMKGAIIIKTVKSFGVFYEIEAFAKDTQEMYHKEYAHAA